MAWSVNGAAPPKAAATATRERIAIGLDNQATWPVAGAFNTIGRGSNARRSAGSSGTTAMTSEEIDDWIEGLGDTDNKRLELLRELMRNAIGDGMSAEDRTICMTALRRLNRRTTQ